MRRLFFVTALALVTTSVASADPDQSSYQRELDRDQARDRGWFTRDLPWRYDGDRDRGFDRTRWVSLAQTISAQTRRQFINLAGRGGHLAKLRFESVRGTPMIQKVVIEYLNSPTARAIQLNTRLPRGEGETIRLAGNQAINRIIVYTQPTYRSAYSILGEPARAEPGPEDTRWVTIADRYSAQSDRQSINVRGGEFRTLRLEAMTGSPLVHKVVIEFMGDSNVQVIEVNARIPSGIQGRVIDLNGGRRQVNRIVVYTDPKYGGSYSIFGT